MDTVCVRWSYVCRGKHVFDRWKCVPTVRMVFVMTGEGAVNSMLRALTTLQNVKLPGV